MRSSGQKKSTRNPFTRRRVSGAGSPALAGERKELLLQLGVGERESVPVEHRAQSRCPGLAREPIGGPTEPVGGQQTQRIGHVDVPLQAHTADCRGALQQHPLGREDPEPIPQLDVTVQPAVSVQADARSRPHAASGNAHVDRLTHRGLAQAPENGRGVVAEHSSRTAAQ